jgi:hypothetical protein
LKQREPGQIGAIQDRQGTKFQLMSIGSGRGSKRSTSMRNLIALASLLTSALLLACGGNDNNANNTSHTGGASGTAGNTGTKTGVGGNAGTGGNDATSTAVNGGNAAAGGASAGGATGGATATAIASSGGSSGIGGTNAVGGAGGTTSTGGGAGGSSSSGGTTSAPGGATGGSTTAIASSGGATSTGGASTSDGAGGSGNAGGTSSIGGATGGCATAIASSGGTTSDGGTSASGGAGGSTSAGGTNATGGSTDTGVAATAGGSNTGGDTTTGASSTGGSGDTGGASATGGSSGTGGATSVADTDGDCIPDSVEIGPNSAQPLDTNEDGTADYLSTDSDGDGIADSVEAGPDCTHPIDSDEDTIPDYRDLDSDGDGLADWVEDKNRDGLLDTGETNARVADTDGDDASDLVEMAMGTDPTNSADNPVARGDFVVVAPYQQTPAPNTRTLDIPTKVDKLDVFFLMDTTGSMSGTIGSLQTSLRTTIIPALAADISSIGIGVGSYRDFPSGGYGDSGDWPYKLNHRIMTVGTSGGLASVQNAVNTLSAGGGADGPESSWEALHQVATGLGTSQGGASVPPFSDATAYPAMPIAGESLGRIPGVGFRDGSMFAVVYFTDAAGHNSDVVAVPTANYSGFTSARSTQAINELRTIGARVIGVASGTGDARNDQLEAVNSTGAVVPPSAWGSGLNRPAGCSATQCCTWMSGAGGAPDSSGMCPLSFLVSTDGTGLGTAVVSGIRALTSFVAFDVGQWIADDPNDAVDAVTTFVDHVEANPTAGAPCDIGLVAIDSNGDTALDTYTSVTPGHRVCFDVVPKINTTVVPTASPQVFKTTSTALGDGSVRLGARNVYFVVPPKVTTPP